MSLTDDARKILRQVAPLWLTLLLDVLERIQTYLKQNSSEGLYEFLEYDFQLELLDTRGRTARLTKHQRVKFLQDNVIAIEDYAWGDGDILAHYTCTPGFVVDRYREGQRWTLLISPRESKHRGEIQDFYIESRPEKALTKGEEWCQIEMQHRTRATKLTVIFPKKRHCRQAFLIERTRKRTLHLDAKHFTLLADGRQLLFWETHEPRRFETYTIKWMW